MAFPLCKRIVFLFDVYISVFFFGFLATLNIHILKKFQLNLGIGVPHCSNHSIESLVYSTGYIF